MLKTGYDDLPDVDGGKIHDEALPGRIYIDQFDAAETDRRIKHLKLVLANHPTAKQMATEREIVFVEDDEKLVMTGHKQDVRSFMLACWRDPVLRKFFDALELRVVEETDQ